MNWDKLEKRLHGLTVTHLTNYLVVITALVSSLRLLTVNQEGGILSEWWIRALLFPFQLHESWILLAIYLYAFWLFGNSLELEMGSFRYSLFTYLGIFLVTLGGIFFPGLVSAANIYLSVFFAIAYLSPDVEILLFFIIPVKVKWIAIIAGALQIGTAMAGALQSSSFIPLLGPLLGSGNFLIFFLPSMLMGAKLTVRRKAPSAVILKAVPTLRHKCTVCGITEADDPHMEFRYCKDCSDHEYCMKHLHKHEHIG